MKINLMLSILGAFFCYSLIVLRSHLDSQLETRTVSATENGAVEIEAAKDYKEELYTSLGIKKVTVESVIFPMDLDAKLRQAIAAGFVKECSHVYSTWRRQFLDEKLFNAGFQKLNIKEVHNRPLNYLKDEIERWIGATNYVVRKLFPNERQLCNRVFFGFHPYADFCFMEVCWGPMIKLLSFANAVATGSGSPERLFRILDVLGTLRGVLPDLGSMFSDQCCVVVRNEAITIWERMEEGIRGVFMELEELISLESAKIAVPGGGLHPINHYVMNFLCAVCESWQPQNFDQVIENSGLRLRQYQKFEDRVSSPTLVSIQVARIMELLECNLKAKSKIYKDSALSSVFMMNNVGYIVQKAKDSELGMLLGDEWIQKQMMNIRKYLLNFEMTSWDQVLDMLSLDNDSLTPDVAAESLRKKLNMFGSQFEDICEVQSTWVIFDDQLREEIRSSLKKTLLLTYEKFMARFHDDVETCRYADIDHDFGFQHIVAGINRLFQGRDELKNRRNIQPTWTVVSPTTKDFHEWKKYGQKTILNSAYPR